MVTWVAGLQISNMQKILSFLAGAASVVGLAWLGHHGRHCCCGGGHRHHHCGCSFCRERRWTHHLFLHLRTTPGQEKAIHGALEDFLDKLRQHRHALRQSAEALGRAVRGAAFDEELVRQVFGRHDQLLAEARQDLVRLLRRVHELLDDSQRDRLARFIESSHGWHSSGYEHHHRGSCGCQ